MPSVDLPSTQYGEIDLSKIKATWTVVYCYPGDKLGIQFPSLRGSTAEASGFRELYNNFKMRGAEVFGVSTQPTSRQAEFAREQHLPFTLLSDEKLAFAQALNLPTLMVAAQTVLDRLTIVVDTKHRIRKVFAQISNPEIHASEVLRFLDTQSPSK